MGPRSSIMNPEVMEAARVLIGKAVVSPGEDRDDLVARLLDAR